MHRFAVDYEGAIDARPRHSAWLAADLTALSLAPLPAQGGCAAAAAHPARLGWRYVMAGSSLGARVLLRDARRLGFARGRGADFLEGHAAADDWSQLQAQLRQLDPDDAPRMAAAVAGARVAFALVRSCLERAFHRIPAALPTEEYR